MFRGERKTDVRYSNRAVKEEPPQDSNSGIGNYFSPDHPDVNTSKWTAVSSRLLDGLPDREKAEAKGEAGGERGNLDIFLGCHVCERLNGSSYRG
jgi:hypothetical protein